MLTIGRFADASGLTVKALRHYDEIGLFAPAHVDGLTGYRYYTGSQVEDAVTIRRLRALEVPLDEIRELLRADSASVRDHLAAHGHRVAAEAHDKQMLRVELAALVVGGDDPLPIEVRDEPELRLAAQIRHVRQDAMATELGAMFRFVADWLQVRRQEPSGLATAVFRGETGHAGLYLVEAGFPVDPDVQGDDAVAVYVYPAACAATYSYSGASPNSTASPNASSPPSSGRGTR